MTYSLDRPDHFHSGPLGDPSACRDNHNHPGDEPTFGQRAERAANNARCQRCDVVILEDSSASGVVFGRLIVPILGVKHEYQLCGKCGLALREFIFPGVLDDPVYLLIKEKLVKEFWT